MQTLANGFARARSLSAHAAPKEAAAVPAVPATPADGSGGGLDIGALTRIELDPRTLAHNRVVVDELTPASSAYKMLRTRVLQRMRRNGWTTVAALNLSISLARNVGTSVVLADVDFRKPSLYRHLGVWPRYGIGDFLRGAAPLEHVAVCPGVERLGVLLNDRPFARSSEMLASPQMENLVQRVKQGEGRIAVFDLPPVLASDDMLAFCPLIDAVLLVVAQGTTRQADIDAARELLQNVNVVGVVLNRSSANVAPYYYGITH
jgi:hypothetical protein